MKTGYIFQNEIKSMMYSAGDIKSPNDHSSQYIEKVVRSQIMKLLVKALNIRNLRRSKSTRLLSVEDICFVIRENRFKIRRVLNSIIFKELRKKINEDTSVINISSEDLLYSWVFEKQRISEIGLNPLFFNSVLDKTSDTSNKSSPLYSLKSPEIDVEQQKRLARIDQLTSCMSYQEYIDFSECRQASFTFRKTKKFKEFLNTTEKLKDDVIDVLGFICYEMVVDIVEEGRKVKNERKNVDIVEKGLFGQEDLKGLDLYETKEACRRIIHRKNSIF